MSTDPYTFEQRLEQIVSLGEAINNTSFHGAKEDQIAFALRLMRQTSTLHLKVQYLLMVAMLGDERLADVPND